MDSRPTLLLVLCLTASAQSRVPVKVSAPAPAIPTATAGLLAQMSAQASVIFSGQILSITPGPGTVDIRFRVDQPIRNCPHTGNYILREWAGLWTANPDRYHVGQRLLMLLTARSAAGLSAPVNNLDGAIPLIATAPQPIADSSGNVPADTALAPVSLSANLALLQTRVLRPPTSNTLLTSQTTTSWSGPTSPLSATSITAPLSTVLNLLTGTSNAGH